MTRVYDNWEKLVAATLDREKLRDLALAPSRETSFSSSIADDFDFSSNFIFNSAFDDNPEEHYFAKSILIAEQVAEVATNAPVFKQQCLDFKSQAEKISLLLREGAAGHQLYSRPAARIIPSVELVLNKVLALVLKCRRTFAIIPAITFRKLSYKLEASIGDVTWLLRVSSPADDEYLGLPPIAFAAIKPILSLIWEQIALMHVGSVDDQADAVSSLISLARGNGRYAKLIVEEGGVGLLLKLLMEGESHIQEHAATAIGLLAIDMESVELMINAGVCFVFAKTLREGRMKVQGTVAWALSKLAAQFPESPILLVKYDIIQLLVCLVEIETVQMLQEHHNQAATVSASKNDSDDASDNSSTGTVDLGDENCLPSYKASEARKMLDPETLTYATAMACRALWHLAKGNSSICESITELGALLSFAVLLEKGSEEAQYNSAMALVEITAMADEDAELRRSAFNPNSPSFDAVVDQLCRVVIQGEDTNPEVLVPCIKAIGNLSRTIKATDTRMLRPLVDLLGQDGKASEEACIALIKFSSPQNIHCQDRSKAIIDAGGVSQLLKLMYNGEQIMQRRALVLLCYIAMHAPSSEELTGSRAINALEQSLMQPYVLEVEVEKFQEIIELVNCVKCMVKMHEPAGGSIRIPSS